MESCQAQNVLLFTFLFIPLFIYRRNKRNLSDPSIAFRVNARTLEQAFIFSSQSIIHNAVWHLAGGTMEMDSQKSNLEVLRDLKDFLEEELRGVQGVRLRQTFEPIGE